MAARLDVIGIGHVTCDIICPVEGWPERDTKTIIPGISLAGGGPAANAIAAVARLGLATGLVGRLGDNLLGRFARDAHEHERIDISRLILDPQAVSPVSVIISDLKDATRTILLTKGENTTLQPDELDWPWLKQASLIHLDGHQMPASLAVAREASSWPNTSVMLDAGSLRDGMVELCALCDIVIAGRRFAEQLTESNEPGACLQVLHDLGVKIAGVTLGEKGSICSDTRQQINQPAYKIDVCDTTGAGDAYHGGFIYAWLGGKELSECMKTASAVAALKCTGIGARDSLPDEHTLRDFLNNAVCYS